MIAIPHVRQLARFEGHIDGIYALTPGLDGNTLISAGADGYIAEWDIFSSHDARLLARVPSSVYAFYIHANHRILYAGTRSGGVHLIDLDQRKEFKLLQWSHQPIFCLEPMTFDNVDTLWIGDGEGNLLLINHQYEALTKIKLGTKAIRCLSWNPTSKLLAIGSSDGMIRLYDPASHSFVQEWKANQPSVFCMLWQNEGNTLWSGGRDALLHEYVKSNELFTESKRLNAHWYTINHMALSPDKRFLATASRDKTVRIWDSESLELQKSLDKDKDLGHTHSVNRLLWFDNETLITAGDDKRILVWNITPQS